MSRNSIKKWAVAAVLGAALVIAGASVAYAYWTAEGAGSGTAETGSNAALTVNQTSVVPPMGPGVAPATLSGDFDNPNTGPVHVTAVTVTDLTTDQPGCTEADYTVGGSADVGDDVDPGDAQGSWSGLTIAFNNSTTDNQDACKGATVTLAFAAS